MMHHRYDALEPFELRWLSVGAGDYMAQRVTATGGNFLAPGDPMGRIAVAAFQKNGPKEAAEVLCAFKRGYDAASIRDGRNGLEDRRLIDTAGTALSIGLSEGEIASVRQELERITKNGPLSKHVGPEPLG